MSQQLLDSIAASNVKADVPPIDVGDTLNVHFRIVEGDKERVQVFNGVVIGIRGRGVNQMMTVRRVVDDVGIERCFPVNSPMVAKYEVVRQGDARRAKLYYLRERTGKSRRLRDKRRGLREETAASPAGGT